MGILNHDPAFLGIPHDSGFRLDTLACRSSARYYAACAALHVDALVARSSLATRVRDFDVSPPVVVTREVVMVQGIAIEPASREDIDAIAHVLASNRDDPGLFQKSATSIADVLDEFLVARAEEGAIVGCAAVHRDQDDLAEVYSVAVTPQAQGRGVGRQLTEACLDHARREGIRRLWLATMRTEFFSRHGFVAIERGSLPRSVLRRKLRMVFEQPASRWLGTLLGRHTFMSRAL